MSDSGGGSDRARQSLSDLFTSLFAPSSSSPITASSALPSLSEPVSRSSVDAAHRADDMRHVRTRPPSPRMSSHSSRTPSTGRSTPVRSARHMSLSTPPPPPSSSAARSRARASQPVFPVLQWFTGKQPSKPPPPPPSASSSAAQPQPPAQAQVRRPTSPPRLQYSDTPIGVSDSPSSSTAHLTALADALHDDPALLAAHAPPAVALPSRPEAARLPPSLRPWRPPSHLAELSRSTLPTACVSPTITSTYTAAYRDPFDDTFAHEHNPDLDLFLSPTPVPLAFPHSPAPAHLQRSPPLLSPSSTRSSIDTLRSIQERSVHTGAGAGTTPPSKTLALPILPNPFEWFSSDSSRESLGKSEPTVPVPKRTRESYATPKHPVVFCHGLLGFDTVTLGPAIAPLQVAHWRGIKDALEANGAEVLVTRVPATSSPVDRARVLEERISAVYPGRAVHLIGHSMGGLDCRYLTTHLTQRKFEVLSITTIATPHRGSIFADHFIATIGRERLPSVLQLLDLLPNGGGDGKAFEFLTVENMRRFNADTPDVPGVKYYSWGAVYEPGLIDTWKWSHSVILEKEGPNDGLVSLNSARWGTYLGTLEGVNHLDLIGWINTTRYKWAEIMGREIKFKPTTFYLGVADHLARVAERQDVPRVEGERRHGQEERRHGQEEQTDAQVGQEEQGQEVSAAEREEIRQEGERVEMAESLSKAARVDVEDAGAEDARARRTAARESASAAGGREEPRRR